MTGRMIQHDPIGILLMTITSQSTISLQLKRFLLTVTF
jgi:hypothetical protein